MCSTPKAYGPVMSTDVYCPLFIAVHTFLRHVAAFTATNTKATYDLSEAACEQESAARTTIITDSCRSAGKGPLP